MHNATTFNRAFDHLLVLPRLRVQNANCISSPMTWGFPSVTAFTGLQTALARKLGADFGLQFVGIAVICHRFEAQVSHAGYTGSFHLPRAPMLKDGTPPAIVEEGRAHLDITLVLAAQSTIARLDEDTRQTLADAALQQLSSMRIAGGSVLPVDTHIGAAQNAYVHKPSLITLAADAAARATQFKRLRRQWLPGFALVSRDDVLQQRWLQLTELAKNSTAETAKPPPTLLDAWLDLSRLNYRSTRDEQGKVLWQTDARAGWLVPIPVGYTALGELHDAGTVANARDPAVPFRFVESVYSIGQWVSPHRVDDAAHLMWHSDYDDKLGLYRCINPYPAPQIEDVLELESDELETSETVENPSIDTPPELNGEAFD